MYAGGETNGEEQRERKNKFSLFVMNTSKVDIERMAWLLKKDSSIVVLLNEQVLCLRKLLCSLPID